MRKDPKNGQKSLDRNLRSIDLDHLLKAEIINSNGDITYTCEGRSITIVCYPQLADISAIRKKNKELYDFLISCESLKTKLSEKHKNNYADATEKSTKSYVDHFITWRITPEAMVYSPGGDGLIIEEDVSSDTIEDLFGKDFDISSIFVEPRISDTLKGRTLDPNEDKSTIQKNTVDWYVKAAMFGSQRGMENGLHCNTTIFLTALGARIVAANPINREEGELACFTLAEENLHASGQKLLATVLIRKVDRSWRGRTFGSTFRENFLGDNSLEGLVGKERVCSTWEAVITPYIFDTVENNIETFIPGETITTTLYSDVYSLSSEKDLYPATSQLLRCDFKDNGTRRSDDLGSLPPLPLIYYPLRNHNQLYLSLKKKYHGADFQTLMADCGVGTTYHTKFYEKKETTGVLFEILAKFFNEKDYAYLALLSDATADAYASVMNKYLMDYKLKIPFMECPRGYFTALEEGLSIGLLERLTNGNKLKKAS